MNNIYFGIKELLEEYHQDDFHKLTPEQKKQVVNDKKMQSEQKKGFRKLAFGAPLAGLAGGAALGIKSHILGSDSPIIPVIAGVSLGTGAMIYSAKKHFDKVKQIRKDNVDRLLGNKKLLENNIHRPLSTEYVISPEQKKINLNRLNNGIHPDDKQKILD